MRYAPMFVLAALIALAGCAAVPAAGDDARIEVDRQADRYVLTGRYDGAGDGLTYRLEVTREGTGGRSTSAQSGDVRGDTLSSSAVSVTAGDRVVAHLTIRDGNRLVAEARLDEVVGA